MLNRFVVPVIAALLVSPIAAPSVFAQPVASPAAPDTAIQTRPGRHGGARIEQRLQQMHDRLGITSAQQPQWDAMVAALHENMQSMRAARPGRADQLTAIQALQTASDRAQARATAMQRMIPSVQALYASLSPEQQHTADQALSQAMHAGKGRRG